MILIGYGGMGNDLYVIKGERKENEPFIYIQMSVDYPECSYCGSISNFFNLDWRIM